MEKIWKQDCIPVGCIPVTHWPYAVACFFWRGSVPGGCLIGGCLLPGGCLLWGVSANRGCLLQGVSANGGCLLMGVSAPRGVSALGGICSGGVCSRGVSAPMGGVCSQGGVWYPNMHWGRHPSPVDRITDACKKHYLGQNFVAAGKNP